MEPAICNINEKIENIYSKKTQNTNYNFEQLLNILQQPKLSSDSERPEMLLIQK